MSRSTGVRLDLWVFVSTGARRLITSPATTPLLPSRGPWDEWQLRAVSKKEMQQDVVRELARGEHDRAGRACRFFEPLDAPRVGELPAQGATVRGDQEVMLGATAGDPVTLCF